MKRRNILTAVLLPVLLAAAVAFALFPTAAYYLAGGRSTDWLFIGVLGALVSFFLLWGIYASIYNAVVASGALTLFNLVMFQSVAWPLLGIFTLAGVVIGAGGSVFAIRKFLQV